MASSSSSSSSSVKKKYIPDSLSKKDKKIQLKNIMLSRKSYKNKKYVNRPKLKSFVSRKSSHIENVKKMYSIKNVSINDELAKKTGCSKIGLRKILKKGMGAYYSSGSRPNQTAQSWGYARLGSSLTGNKSSRIDYHILQEHCTPNSRALKIAKKPHQQTNSKPL